MLKYKFNGSSESSHFFITTPQDNICILNFAKIDEEILNFNDEFLQENIKEMVVAKFGQYQENYCKELAETIKHVFDELLEAKDNLIIYVSVDEDSLKHQLIKRYIANDNNAHFNYLMYKVEDKVFAFFFNQNKINAVQTYIDLEEFFKNEFGLEFEPISI